MATTDSTTSTTTASSSYTYSSYSSSSSSSSTDLDWSALVEAAVAQKTTKADTIDTKIEQNEAKIAAYQEMQTLLQAIASAAGSIRGTENSLTANDDAFSLREAYLTGYGDVNAESAVVVTVDADAELTSYDLEIKQLATAQKVAGSTYADKTTDLGLTGTFTIGLEDMEQVTVEVDDDMTLAEIAEAINLTTDESGVSASVLEVANGDFRLILSASQTGQQIQITDTSGSGLGQSLGLTDVDGNWVNELQEAKNSIVTIDGIEITRSTNTLDDVIEGVTFTLYQETENDATINVEISNDLTSIKSAITNLVEAYNAYREWALTQAETATAGGASSDAILFGDATLRSVNTAVAEALSTVIDKDSMAMLGLSYDESNYLELDEDTLNSALLQNLDEVEKLISFTMTKDSKDIALLSRNASMPASLSLDIEVDADGAVSRILVDGKEGMFEVSGSRIKGVEGTEYEGITFVFTGDTSQTVNMTFSSGILEKLYSAVNKYSDASDSILTNLVTSLTETNEDLEEEASDIRSKAETYRSNLTLLYAEYQAQIDAAQSSLDYLEALLNAGDD